MTTEHQLIADSGGTSTTWYWNLQTDPQHTTTSGCQPYYRTTAELVEQLSAELLPSLPDRVVDRVFFYGAGCSAPSPRKTVADALKALFPQAVLEVQSDLLGAARALSGREPGICCILGTGSASGYYDGTALVDQVPSLGYLLGDEGSGADLGRRLLQAYFYRQLPEELRLDFENQYHPERHAIIQGLLQDRQPNRTLARYTLFAAKWAAHPFVQALVCERFDVFLEGQISRYAAVPHVPIHALGSVAHGFAPLWRQAVESWGWTAGRIYQSPFPDLLRYHSR